MRDAVFALCWLVLLPAALCSAFPAILTWIWVAIFAPNDQLFGFMADVPFNKIIAGATAVVLVLSPERKAFYIDRTVIALALFVLVGTISAGDAFADWADGWDLYGKLVKEIVLAILIMGTLWSRYRIHMAIFTMCIAFGFEAVVESTEFIITAGGHKVLGARSVGDNNSLAVEMLMAIPLLWYLVRYSAVRYVKVVLGVVLALSVITVIATSSRGGFIGLMVLGLIFITRSRNKVGSLLLMALAAALIFVSVPDNYVDRVQTIDEVGGDSSFMGRVNAWKVSTLEALDSPFYGAGFHAVQHSEVWEHYRARAEAITLVDTPPLDVIPHAAHSIYFEVLGDLGFTGLLLFGALVLFALRATGRVRRLARAHPAQQWAGDLANAMQVSLVLFLLCGAALSMAYWEGFYIFLALISRLQKTVVEAVATKADDQPPADAIAAAPAGLVAATAASARKKELELAGARRLAAEAFGKTLPRSQG